MPIIANFGGGGGVSKTDDTLTKPGLPADAKATGEALDDIKKYADSIVQISDMEPTDPSTEIWINPEEDGGDGGIESSSLATHNTDINAHADIRERISQLSDDKIDKFFLFDYAETNNYADMSMLKMGMIHTNGTVYTGSSYDNYRYLEDYIPVEQGEELSIQCDYNGVRYWSVNENYPNDGADLFMRVCAYDTEKNVLSSLGATTTSSVHITKYTVPAGVSFVRVTFNYSEFIAKATNIAIVKNATGIISYQEFGSAVPTTIKPELLPASNVDGGGVLFVSLPDYVHVKTGNEFRVYFRNVLSRNDAVLWIGYNNSLTTRYYDDYFSVTASTEGEFELPWKVYDQAWNLLESGSLNVIATAKAPIETTEVMVIGDSTVNDGSMTAKVAELYTADGAVLNLLGTRGGATHEGRGGWTAKMYCTVASSGGVINPFYNNGFDFAYYMANQKFSGIQVVAIQLGINDIFAFKDYSWASYDSAPVLGYINEMVTSILAYSPSIKVIINLPTTPNSDGHSFTETYGTTQLYWIYNRNIIRFAKELKEYFKSNVHVIISASNCILDTKTQIRDGVHPTTDGYNALGQRLYEVLVGIVDGQVVVLPLLDISTRTRVPHTGSTISATSQRALDTTKCYDEVFNGTRAQNGIITAYTANGPDSLSVQVSTAGGTGMNFPVALEAGKTYTLKYTLDNTGRVYVMKYNGDTTYNSNTMLSSTVGTFNKTITPEEGYLYGLLFVPMVKDTLVTFSGIELTENTGLWNLASRTAVVNTYAPAGNTRTISNNCYYYPCAYTGYWVDDASGDYTISNVSVGENSVSFQCKNGAYGIFVPFLNLDSSKTYRFNVNPTVAGFRVYLVNYDSTGVYVNNQIVVDKTTGLTTFEFTPVAGYQQGFCFACLNPTENTLGTFTDLSLVEVTE